MAIWLILVATAAIIVTAALTSLLWRINAAQMARDAEGGKGESEPGG